MFRTPDIRAQHLAGGRATGRLMACLCLLLAGCTAAPAAAPTTAPAKPTTAAAAPASSAASPASAAVAKPAASPSAAASPAASPAVGVPSPSAAAKPAASGALSAANTFDEQAVASFYRGKTLRLIVGYGPGGGYDIFARIVAKYVPKYLPGNPTVVVENQPGAGSAVALAQVYRQLPKDGTVVATGSGGLAAEQALGTQTFEFDSTKFQYIGAPDQFEYPYVFLKKALDERGVKTVQDIMGPNSKQVVVAAVSSTGTDARVHQIMRAAFGLNFKIVSGYSGTAAEFTAMESGEVDGLAPPWDTLKAGHMDDIKDGRYVLPMQLPENGIKDLPYPVPKMIDLATTDEQRQLLHYGVTLPLQFARTYVMAPEVPADRVAAMRAAFDKIMADPEYQADVHRAQLEVNPLSGAQLQQLIQEYFGLPAGIKARLKEIYTQPA